MSFATINKKTENCPFCDGPAEARVMPEYNRIVFGCFNEKCMFKPKISSIDPNVSFDEVCEIINGWNTRAIEKTHLDDLRRISDLWQVINILDSDISRDANECPFSDLLIHDVNSNYHYYYQADNVTDAYRILDIFSDLLFDYGNVDVDDALEILYGIGPVNYACRHKHFWDKTDIHSIEIVDNRNDGKCFIRIGAPTKCHP